MLDRKPYFFRQSHYSGTKYEARHLNREYYPFVNVMIIRIQEGMVCFWKATRLRWINHRNILVYFEDENLNLTQKLGKIEVFVQAQVGL